MVDRQDTVELLQELVSINSMNPSLTEEGKGEEEIAQYLGSYLEKLGLEVYYQDLENRRKNVIGILRGKGGGKSIILNAHTDTVGAEGMEKPCEPRIEEKRVYGRGSYDMKGGLVSSIMALKNILESEDLSGDVIFAGVADEEFWSIGTEELIKEYTADAAIICEPTDSRIVIAHKGFSWITVTVHGKAAHGSKPHLGIDAISKATKLMNEISSLQEEFKKREHRLVGPPAIRVSKIEGGLGLSTIPDKCTLYIERRTLPSENKDTIINELNAIFEKIKTEDDEFSADFEITIYRPGLEVSESEEIVQILANNHELISGQKPVFDGEPWWMDSALLADVGIPTVILGPKGDGAHAAEEYVEIDSVVQIAKILESTIIEFCR